MARKVLVPLSKHRSNEPYVLLGSIRDTLMVSTEKSKKSGTLCRESSDTIRKQNTHTHTDRLRWCLHSGARVAFFLCTVPSLTSLAPARSRTIMCPWRAQRPTISQQLIISGRILYINHRIAPRKRRRLRH